MNKPFSKLSSKLSSQVNRIV